LYGPFGNHVAARRFSSSQLSERFIDFQHEGYITDEVIINYAPYIASVMTLAPYYDGDMTDTAAALTKVYQDDLPTSRGLNKNRTIVLVRV